MSSVPMSRMKMFRRSVRVSKGNSSQISDIAVYNSLAKEIGHTEERAEELEEALEIEVEVGKQEKSKKKREKSI